METGDPLAGTERNEVSAKNNGFSENGTCTSLSEIQEYPIGIQTGCVLIRQKCHSGRAHRLWARPVIRHTHHPERSRRGIQENSGKSKHSGSRLASRSAGFGRDDELRHALQARRAGIDVAPIHFPRENKNLSRPLKNVQFCSRSRKAKILTAGIHDKYFEDQNLSLTPGLGKRGRLSKVSHHFFRMG